MQRAPAAPDRYDVALAAVAPQPGDRILEIGCGHGVFVDRLCQALAGDGEVIAVDRSPSMVEAAARRNIRWVEAGVATFRMSSAVDLDLEVGSLDAAVAIRVRGVWSDGAETLERVAGWLRPGGAVHLVLDDPGAEQLEEGSIAASTALVVAGFVDVQRVQRSRQIVVVTGRRD